MTLFVIVAVCAVITYIPARWCWAINAEQAAVEKLQKLGAHVLMAEAGSPHTPGYPAWFLATIGQSDLRAVDAIFLDEDLLGGQAVVNDETLRLLESISSVRGLIIRSNDVTDDGLSCCRGLRRLKGLSVSCPKASGRFLSVLTCDGLERLSIHDCDVTDDAIHDLARFPRLKNVTLAGMRITDAALVELASLENLKELSIPRTAISGATLDELRLSNLEALDLSGTQVTDASLSKLRPAQSLKLISFDDTKITDRGLEHVAELRSLKVISADRTQITDSGL